MADTLLKKVIKYGIYPLIGLAFLGVGAGTIDFSVGIWAHIILSLICTAVVAGLLYNFGLGFLEDYGVPVKILWYSGVFSVFMVLTWIGKLILF